MKFRLTHRDGVHLLPLLLLAAVLGFTTGCARTQDPGPHRGVALGGDFKTVPIGIGEDYSPATRTLDDVRRDLELIHSKGLRILRVSFPWDAIEPEPGRYDFAFWDEFVSMAAGTYGIRLLPYVCYTPAWASKGRGDDPWRYPPRDMARFSEFMKKIAARYQGRVHSWEIWNEPDNREFWRGSWEEFAALLTAGSRAVHEADPQAKVVLGGLAWDLNLLEELLAKNPGLPGVDVINLHNYNETWSGDALERISEYVGRARDVIARGGGRQQIWMAEDGYSSHRRGSYVSAQVRAFYDYEHTPQHQASSLFRMMTLFLASGKVSLVTWYRIHDLPETEKVIGDGNNHHLGVIDRTGRPKPALHALLYFHSLFAGPFRCIDDRVHVAKKISSALEAHAFRLQDGRTVITAWLKTVVPGERGAPSGGKTVDRREERMDILLPFTTAKKARVFDELGQERGTIPVSRRKGKSRIAGLTLRPPAVTVIILEEEKRRGR